MYSKDVPSHFQKHLTPWTTLHIMPVSEAICKLSSCPGLAISRSIIEYSTKLADTGMICGQCSRYVDSKLRESFTEFPARSPDLVDITWTAVKSYGPKKNIGH